MKLLDEVTIRHETKDGRAFIVRYGELDPNSVRLRIGDMVKQGDFIGKTGKLLTSDNTPLLTLSGRIIYMLHFEYYTGGEGLDLRKRLTDRTRMPYQRRSDLHDPLELLKEGYRNTFGIDPK